MATVERAGWDRYRRAVKGEGWAWYEGEVHPRVVMGVMERQVGKGRSYEMGVGDYEEWLERTGMDMVYGYMPWKWGREETMDEWGRFTYKGPGLEVGDLVGRPPYEEMKKRLDELCGIPGGRGVEWAIYNTPMVVEDGLGLEKFALAMMDKPRELEDWMERIDERVAKELEVALEWPVEVVQFSQVFADKNGPMFGAEELERFHFCYLDRRVKRVRNEHRLAALHCDGDCSKVYDRLDIDVFNGYEGRDHGKDMEERKWGWRGSVPTGLLETGKSEEITAFVKALKRPHVIGSTHDTGDVPLANFVAMMEAARVLAS